MLSFANLLNCKVHKLPLKFLGLPLGANPGRKSMWKPVLHKIKVKLAGWKRKLLSFAGRLTLIKSVLSSLPTYYLSLFKMPEGVAKEIEKIQAAFLWGGNDLKRKVHLVKWVDITKLANQGGLGIRRIRDVNTCLLLKWWWKFGNQVNALWRRAICSKYKINENCWHPPLESHYKHSRLWTDIISIGASSRNIFNFYLVYCLIKVGNGSRILFWHDKWCGGLCLKSEFPLLYNLTTENEGSLHYFYHRKFSSDNWNFQYRRELYDWELLEEIRLVIVLSSSPPLCLDMVDCLVWANGSFSVSALYSFSSSQHGPLLQICKFVWYNALPPKVLFFGWLAWKNRLKTAELLHRLGILSSSASTLCPFCSSEIETAVHILLHCPFSWCIWSSVIQDWGFNWCIQGSVEGLFYWWMGGKLKRLEKKIWKAIPLVVLWSLWKHRNECVFSLSQPNSFGLYDLIKTRTVLWLKATSKDFPLSVDDYLFKWNQIRC